MIKLKIYYKIQNTIQNDGTDVFKEKKSILVGLMVKDLLQSFFNLNIHHVV